MATDPSNFVYSGASSSGATSANQTSMIAALGAPADAEVVAGNGSIIALLKRLRTLFAGNLFHTGMSGALAASTPYTGAARDVGVTAGVGHVLSYFNGFFRGDAAGTAYIDASTDGSAWFEVASAAMAANTPLILSVPVMARYHRTRFVNGSTPQTALVVNSSYTAA